MVNGYVSLPSKLVDEINKMTDSVLAINDKEIVAQMNDIVRLGKPVYIKGLYIGEGFVDTQLLHLYSEENWAYYFIETFGGSEFAVKFALSIAGEFNQNYFTVEKTV